MIERNDVLTFSETDKVIVLDVIKYNDIVYAIVNEVTPDEEDVTDKYFVMQYDAENEGMMEITDKQLLEKLLPLFSTRVSNIADRKSVV